MEALRTQNEALEKGARSANLAKEDALSSARSMANAQAAAEMARAEAVAQLQARVEEAESVRSATAREAARYKELLRKAEVDHLTFVTQSQSPSHLRQPRQAKYNEIADGEDEDDDEPIGRRPLAKPPIRAVTRTKPSAAEPPLAQALKRSADAAGNLEQQPRARPAFVKEAAQGPGRALSAHQGHGSDEDIQEEQEEDEEDEGEDDWTKGGKAHRLGTKNPRPPPVTFQAHGGGGGGGRSSASQGNAAVGSVRAGKAPPSCDEFNMNDSYGDLVAHLSQKQPPQATHLAPSKVAAVVPIMAGNSVNVVGLLDMMTECTCYG